MRDWRRASDMGARTVREIEKVGYPVLICLSRRKGKNHGENSPKLDAHQWGTKLFSSAISEVIIH